MAPAFLLVRMMTGGGGGGVKSCIPAKSNAPFVDSRVPSGWPLRWLPWRYWYVCSLMQKALGLVVQQELVERPFMKIN